MGGELDRVEEILRKKEGSGSPTWERMERFDGKITPDQGAYLRKAARKIMRTRTGEKVDRITANSLLRVAIEVFRELHLELEGQDIPTERELLRRALNAIKKKG